MSCLFAVQLLRERQLAKDEEDKEKGEGMLTPLWCPHFSEPVFQSHCTVKLILQYSTKAVQYST